jgi:hypothetical protein
MLSALVLPATGSALAAPNFPDPAMQNVWTRTDKSVEDHSVARSWMWGPEIFNTRYEAYAEGPGGQHLVAYFDKSRMEINNPNGDRNNLFFVTNGLLVVEMMTGRIQTGNNSFQQVAPANIPIAGDPGNPNTPTYAKVATVATLSGNNSAPNRVGQPIAEGLQNTGGVGTLSNLSGYARYGAYDTTLGHNIADVFWTFMNQRGPVIVNGRVVQDTVIDWTFAMGYPLTEPYWMPIQVGAEQRWVLVQAFQRRILTYSPNNPAGFQVEMGNVGRSYYDWRYSGQPVPPTVVPPPPPPPAGQAAITLNPTRGDGNTTIAVNGVNFPANSQIVVQVERPDASYYASVAALRAGGDGKFAASFRLPTEAAKFANVTISATANPGAVRAAAQFDLNYNPSIDIAPKGYVVNGGSMTVRGSGFPPVSTVRIGVLFDGQRNPEYPAQARTDGNGAFQASFTIGSRSVGARFLVFATAPGGIEAGYADRVTVVNQPALRVTPSSGPVGVNVTLTGSGWPAGQQVTIGFRGAGVASEGFLPNPVPVDGAGNFAIQVWVDPNLGNRPQVIFSGTSGNGALRAEAIYTVASNPPPPANPAVAVSPSTMQAGQTGTVTGSGWTPNSQVTISLNGAGRQENVAVAGVDRDGNFRTGFAVSGLWAGAGQVVVTASSNTGQVATTVLTIIASGGGANLEYGLDMTVLTYRGFGNSYVKLTGTNWRAGLNLTISVVSARGDVNVGITNVIVQSNGTWQASFNSIGTWVGRPDIGVRASDPTGAFASGRRLPVTIMSKVSGRTYVVRGANWGPGTQVQAVFQIDGEDVQGLGSSAVDANGNFALNVTLPGGGGERQVVVSTRNSPVVYTAIVGIDQSVEAGASEPSASLSPPGQVTRVPAIGPVSKSVPLVGMPATGAGDANSVSSLIALVGSVALCGGLVMITRKRSL